MDTEEFLSRFRVRFDGYVWRIDEIVSSKGYYITWPQAFGSADEAKDYCLKELGIRPQRRMSEMLP